MAGDSVHYLMLTDGQNPLVGPIDIDTALRTSGATRNDIFDLERIWGLVRRRRKCNSRKDKGRQCVLHRGLL